MRKLQVKRGTAANTPTLADGELGLQTDAGKLLVGNQGENLPVAMGAELAVVKTEMAGKATANHTHTKADVGLSNVDNTADSQKSVNYAGTSGNTNAVGGRAAATVLSEIDNLKTSVANGKAQIASAISDKGVSTGAGADFGTMANNIRAIQTGYLGGAFNRAWNYERISVSTSYVFSIPTTWSYYLIPDYYDGSNSSYARITIYDIAKGYGITLQCGEYVTAGGAVTFGNGTIEVPSMEGRVRINQTQIVAVSGSIYVPVWYA